MSSSKSQACWTPTIYGVLALIFWGICPAFVCKIRHIPVFQLSMLFQGIGFLFILGVTIKQKKLKIILMELPKSFIMVPFVIANQICYLYAFRLAPPDQVDLINYLWPVMTVVGSSFLFAEKMTITRGVGILVGFSAIVLLGRHEILTAAIGSQFFWGYAFAFGAAVFWTAYTLLGRSLKGVAAYQHIGFHVGFSSLVMAVLHVSFDDGFIPLEVNEWGVVASLGILAYGLGYPLWWYGIAKGRFALLTSLSYLAPIISILALVVTGVVDPSWDLAIACLMVTAGSWLVNQNTPVIENWFKPRIEEDFLDLISFANLSHKVEWQSWEAELIEHDPWKNLVASRL